MNHVWGSELGNIILKILVL